MSLLLVLGTLCSARLSHQQGIGVVLPWWPWQGSQDARGGLGAPPVNLLSSILQPVSMRVALAALLPRWAEWHQWHCIPLGSFFLEETWPRDPRVLGLHCEKVHTICRTTSMSHRACISVTQHQPSWPSLGIRDQNAYWDCHEVCP